MKQIQTSIKVGAGLLLVGILIATTLPRKAGAQPQKPSQSAAAVIWFGEDTASGLVIYKISVSGNALRFNPGDSLAEAIATYAEQGYTMSQVGAWYTFVKAR